MPEKIEIDIDTYQLMRKLKEVENKKNEVEAAVESTEKTAAESFNQVMVMARTAWVMTSNIIRAAGGTIETVFRLVIQTALSSAQVLGAIFATEATAGSYIQAAIGFANLVLMFAAIARMEEEHSKIVSQIRATQYALMSAANLIYYIPSLW